MSAVLVIRPTSTQNLLFVSQQMAETITSTLFLPIHGRVAKLNAPEWPEKYGNDVIAA